MMFKQGIFIVLAYVTIVQGLVLPNLNLFEFPGLNEVSLVHKVEQQVQKVEQQVQQMLNDVVKDEPVPIINNFGIDDIIPHHYIIVFKKNVKSEDIKTFTGSLLSKFEQELISNLNQFTISEEFSGLSGYLPPNVLEYVRKSNLIEFIEPDSKVKLNEFDIQKGAPWGLTRISHRHISNDLNYLYDNEGGKGVDAYVIDTGIKTDHEEFEGRATWGAAIALPKLEMDTNGHGTHCAGIIGSKTYGVAKKVNLYAVGVMNMFGMGSTSDIIKGIEFVVQQHKSKTGKRGFKGSTVNLSLGGGSSDAFDLAVNAGVNAGLHIAVAAGNDNKDACDYSPARADLPISVGASNINNDKAEFSNWGKCVDVFAPGQDIESTYIWNDKATLSGTSMASPHVAGLLSYYLSLLPEGSSEFSNGVIEPKDMKRKLLKYTTNGVIKGLDTNSPNKLIFNGGGQSLDELWKL